MTRWVALGTDVLGMEWVRYISYGHTIELTAGFYRSPDVMGWHAAALSMFSLIMVIYGKSGPRWFWIMLACWGALSVFISGRNKMIGMLAAWVILTAVTYIYVGRGQRAVTLALVGGILGFSVLFASGQLDLHDDYSLYASQLATGAVIERFGSSGIGELIVTFRQSGFFGEGIGVSAQGVQHLGVPIKRSWQEAGGSRILVELGVIGLIAAVLVAWRLFNAIRNLVRYQLREQTTSAKALQLGLAGFIGANIANFIMSHQVYSDGVILVMVALVLGMLLSSPIWLNSSIGRQSRGQRNLVSQPVQEPRDQNRPDTPLEGYNVDVRARG